MSEVLIHLAHAWGVTGAALLSGFIVCFSHAGVPTLSIAPVDTLVHQFKTMYNIGKATSPLVAITVTICNGYSAYCAKDSTDLIGNLISPFALYTAATVCVPSIVPYTLLYMEPAVNKKLLTLGGMVENGTKAKDLGVGDEEVRSMLKRWKGMNFVRATLVATGAVLSALATFR
ncbi:hypothetical protein yc1106_04622 [Curvularia clavata]|uniref:DUF1772-domain-containing protein n=1 Tax=Curvularia clavata TaxID=95742 RepID=A0A9Q9DRD4_CURCL|nr:hypothetical protein yc1106_04622 [Curvularia clavata]